MPKSIEIEQIETREKKILIVKSKYSSLRSESTKKKKHQCVTRTIKLRKGKFCNGESWEPKFGILCPITQTKTL